VKGFERERTCAVIDKYPIDHLDTHTGTSKENKYRGEPYGHWGIIEWNNYKEQWGPLLKQDWDEKLDFEAVPL
jgi:hypothetical protein